MADKPTPLNQDVLPVTNDGLAPFVYFEEAPNFGVMNGVCHISLATYRHTRTNDGIKTDLVAVASLRGNVQSFLALKGAIDSALLLAAPPADGGMAN